MGSESKMSSFLGLMRIAFPQPLGAAVEKLWGYTSQYGRHVQEGKPADFNEAEMVVGLAGTLSVYLLRKSQPTC